ncbi:MAG: ABC transporter ATP-binding protein [Alphaproteobacteria bacterium]|nr:ABC transporter ATP-binding protein [Alphaproteobacteria bacterium]
MTDLLSVRNLAIEFRIHDTVVRAVNGVSFRIRPGSTVALVGESGSGKSVISQAIMGILPRAGRIASGEILFADPKQGSVTDIAALDPDGERMRKIRGGRISIIFQEPMTSLSPLHTIGDQILEALHLHRPVDKNEGQEIAADMLNRVGFKDPKKALSIYPFELSGGLRQRAMIAMALVCRPALLIADEPTTALDVTIQAQILKLLSDLQQELGMAILMITHDLGVVANMAEEVVVMYHGKIMEAGTRDDVFRDPHHPYLKALLHAVPRFNMAPGERLVPLREIKYAPDALAHLRVPWPEGGDAAGPLLSIRHVRKRFSIRKSGWLKGKSSTTVLAVDDVSFEVRRGECLGLVGESGCGKTTLSKLMMRAITADTGEVLFNDRGRMRNVFDLSSDELIAFRRKVQFVFQDPFSSLNPRMTVFDIISEPLIIHRIGTAESRAETVREMMRLVGLDVRFLNRYPHSFSGGQRQRIGIARALALQPELLLLDEPVSALDVSIQAQILNFLKDLKKQLGLTYIFISHNLAVVDYVADRIAVMCAGRLVEMAPREVLFRRPVHPYTRALLAAVPEPDPDRRLDLTMLMEGRASIPAAWAQPFTLDGGIKAAFIDLGDGHFVRAAEGASRHELMRMAEKVPA